MRIAQYLILILTLFSGLNGYCFYNCKAIFETVNTRVIYQAWSQGFKANQLDVFTSDLTKITRKEIESRRVYIGISLGMTPKSVETALQVLKGAIKLAPTQPFLPIVIGDHISKFNESVFAGRSAEGAGLRKALEEGQLYRAIFMEALLQLPMEQRQKFKILLWDDIIDKAYLNMIELLTRYSETNPAFDQMLLQEAQDYMLRRNPRLQHTEKRLRALKSYRLNELPLLLRGIQYENQNYGILIHPIYGKDKVYKGDPTDKLIQKTREDPILDALLNLDGPSIAINVIYTESEPQKEQ